MITVDTVKKGCHWFITTSHLFLLGQYLVTLTFTTLKFTVVDFYVFLVEIGLKGGDVYLMLIIFIEVDLEELIDRHFFGVEFVS